MNFGALTNYVMNASKRFADREVARQHINEAYMHLCLQTRCNRTSETVTLPATTTGDFDVIDDLGIPDMQSLRFITWSGPSTGINPYPLQPTSISDILSLRMAAPASPWVRAYSFQPPRTLSLYPVGSVGDTLTIYYNARPDPMELDTDEPDLIPPEFHRVIAWGAIAEADLDSRTNPVATNRYQQGVRELRGYVNQADSAIPDSMPGALRTPLYHDRSTDMGA